MNYYVQIQPTLYVYSFLFVLHPELIVKSQAIWKRRISVLRRVGRIDRAVEELNAYLDTFYTDVEGWLELADIHSSCNQYVSVLVALYFARNY